MQQRFSKIFLTTILIGLLSGCGSLPRAPESTPSRSNHLPDFSLSTSAGLEDISIHAISLIGTPYTWGGNTPQGGFDCSGLVVYVISQTRQQKLPRTSNELGKIGHSLQKQAPAPGDLVFFNTLNDPYSHVGIYVGQGRFVHAPKTGGTVRLDSIESSYWGPRYTEARRVIGN